MYLCARPSTAALTAGVVSFDCWVAAAGNRAIVINCSVHTYQQMEWKTEDNNRNQKHPANSKKHTPRPGAYLLGLLSVFFFFFCGGVWFVFVCLCVSMCGVAISPCQLLFRIYLET